MTHDSGSQRPSTLSHAQLGNMIAMLECLTWPDDTHEEKLGWNWPVNSKNPPYFAYAAKEVFDNLGKENGYTHNPNGGRHALVELHVMMRWWNCT